MAQVESSSSHVLELQVAGVCIHVEVEASSGDPSLNRDFADQVAQVVEDYLHTLSHTGESENVLEFRLTAAH